MSEILQLINLISAKIAVLALLVVSIKYISKRIGNEKVNRILMKVHIPAGKLTLLAGIIHMCASLAQFSNYNVLTLIFGGISLLAIGASIFFASKKKRNLGSGGSNGMD